MQLDLLQPQSPPAAPKDKLKISLVAHEDEKAEGAFKTISEAAQLLGVPPHVLRFWETRFPQIKPLKLRGGRRYYRPHDIDALLNIKQLLYKQGYTIKGAKKHFGHRPGKTKGKAPVNDKQRGQLASIREELSSLRETLKNYI